MITTRAVENANAPLPNHDRNVPNQRGDEAKAGDAAKANAARAGESEARAGPRGDQNPPKEKDAGSVLDPLPRSVLVPVPDQKARPEALAPATRERSAAPPELREKPKPPERGKAALDQDLHHRSRKRARERPERPNAKADARYERYSRREITDM